MASMSRKDYAHMFGPTVGDRMRLADTDLWIDLSALIREQAAAQPASDARSLWVNLDHRISRALAT